MRVQRRQCPVLGKGTCIPRHMTLERGQRFDERFGRSGDSRMLEIEDLPVEERRVALYGEPGK